MLSTSSLRCLPAYSCYLAGLIAFALYIHNDDEATILQEEQELHFSSPTVLKIGVRKLAKLRLRHLIMVFSFGLVLWLLRWWGCLHFGRDFWLLRLWRRLNIDHDGGQAAGQHEIEDRDVRVVSSFRMGVLHVHERYLLLALCVASLTIPLVCLVRTCLLTQSPPTEGFNGDGQHVRILYDSVAIQRYRRALATALELLGDAGTFCHGFFLVVLTAAIDVGLVLYGGLSSIIWMCMKVLKINNAAWAVRLYYTVLARPVRSASLANGALARALETKSKVSVFVGVMMHPLMYGQPEFFPDFRRGGFGHPMAHGFPHFGMPGGHPMMHGFPHFGMPGGHPMMHGFPHFDMPFDHPMTYGFPQFGFPGDHPMMHGIDYPLHPHLVPREPPLKELARQASMDIFKTVVVAPLTEEAVFRYVFSTVWRCIAAVVLKISRRPNSNSESLYGYRPWALVSSLLFAASHLNNHIPRSEDVPFLLQNGNDEALAVVTRAVTQLLVTFVLSLYVFAPLYDRWGVWASIGAHFFWNASCFGAPILIVFRVLYRAGVWQFFAQRLSLMHRPHRQEAAVPQQEHVRTPSRTTTDVMLLDEARRARLARLDGPSQVLNGGTRREEDRLASIDGRGEGGVTASTDENQNPEVAPGISAWPRIICTCYGIIGFAIFADLLLSASLAEQKSPESDSMRAAGDYVERGEEEWGDEF